MTAEVQDNEDGSYAVSYTATSAGVYELHITLGAGCRSLGCFRAVAGHLGTGQRAHQSRRLPTACTVEAAPALCLLRLPLRR